MASSQPIVVLPIVAGIGNALMTVPLARQIKRALPGDRLIVAARLEPMAEVFRRLDEVDEVIVVGPTRKWLGVTLRLRLRGPGLCIVPFPSNRWQYTAIAVACGARRLIQHSYPVGRWRTGAFLRATRIPAIKGLHDVEQNLRLLTALGYQPDYTQAPTFALRQADHAAASHLLRDAQLDDHEFVAVHAGSANTVLAQAKRWPPASYAGLIARIEGNLGHRVALVEGPDERGVADEILSHLPNSSIRPVRLAGGLAAAAALLARARLYVGSDSGLAHLAAAVGTPPITLFAPADPDRVCPFGYRHLVLQPARSCVPCFAYPWRSTRPRIECATPTCITDIAVETVAARVAHVLSANHPSRDPGRKPAPPPSAASRPGCATAARPDSR